MALCETFKHTEGHTPAYKLPMTPGRCSRTNLTSACILKQRLNSVRCTELYYMYIILKYNYNVANICARAIERARAMVYYRGGGGGGGGGGRVCNRFSGFVG